MNMQPLLISDYILGYSFNKRYAGTLIEQLPTFVHQLVLFKFQRSPNGDYQFPGHNDTTDIFIRMSMQEKSYGVLLIVLQKYLNDVANESQKNVIFNPETKKEEIDLPDKFTGLVKIENFHDIGGDLVEGIFTHIDKELNEVILAYVYRSGAIGFCRCNYNNIHFNTEIQLMDKEVLKHLSVLKDKELKFTKDNVRDKHKNRFTQQPYLKL